MNKKFKLACIATSVVMAGTMAFGAFGCSSGGSYNEVTTSASQIVTKLNNTANIVGYIWGKNNAWQRLKAYAESGFVATATEGKQAKLQVAESYSPTTKLVFDVGDDAKRSVGYKPGNYISGTITLPDGKRYSSDSLKPAWDALKKKLGLEVKDNWSTGKNKVTTAMTANTDTGKLSARDIITDGAKVINDNSNLFLDLSNYFDEMPRYKQFLDENPIVRLSLTADTETGAMYVAPYFDGYDDIEKYDLFKTNWVEALLDNTTGGDTTTTFKSHLEVKKITDNTSSSIESYMGKTGSWSVDILNNAGQKVENGITVSYDKALAAAINDGTPLGAAIKDAAGNTVYDGESGNIVDLMNFAIDTTEGEVTGAKLLKILQEYIKVAYYAGTTNTPFYTQTGYKLSDVFAGNSAAWDVDLYAAIGRCLVTNPSLLKSGKTGNTIGGANATPLSNLYLVAARQSNMQRMADTVSFVGELYGIRGIEGYNLYSYIDANGNLLDVRGDYESYDAFNAFSKFYDEGLVYAGGADKDAQVSFYVENTVEVLSYHDYVNTQTPAGFQVEGIVSNNYSIEDDYCLTPVITPVSKWNTSSSYDKDFNPTNTEYMRMINSWRSVKDTGFAVPLAAVQGNPEKLKAVLAFIDYLFSEDGQIAMTYGPKADNADSDNGFWYNREATQAEINAGTYFDYEGKKLYSETVYRGKYVPTVTEKVKKLYYGEEVNGVKVDGKMTGSNAFGSGAACVRSYSNFARYVIGSALPIGNKLQSFEYQMTSEMGKQGAAIVDAALTAGIIRHPYPKLTNDYNNNPFYTLVPTVLPFTDDEKALNAQAIQVSDTGPDRFFTNNKSNTTNLYWEIIKYGYNASLYDYSMFGSIGLDKR